MPIVPDPRSARISCIERRGSSTHHSPRLQCPVEQLLAPAVNCGSKSRASLAASGSVTAWHASAGQEVSLPHSPASPPRTRSRAQRPNTYARGTREPGSGSGSARSAARPYSTPKKGAKGRASQSLSARSLIRRSRRPKTRCTTAVVISGFSCRQGSPRMRKTRRSDGPYRHFDANGVAGEGFSSVVEIHGDDA
jgi:hypothetical protein